MARKDEVLRILKDDATEARGAVARKYGPAIKDAEKAIAAAKGGYELTVARKVDRCLPASCALRGTEKLRFGYFDSRRPTDRSHYGNIVVDVSKTSKIRRAVDELHKLVVKRDGAMAAINDRAGAIRRQITLHGVDPEIIKMLEDFKASCAGE